MAWPGILTLSGQPSPLLAVAHTARLPLVNLPLKWGKLRPGVLGTEKEEKPPSSFLSPLAHGKDLSFLSVSPFTLVLYCSVKETVVTKALSKSARLVQ